MLPPRPREQGSQRRRKRATEGAERQAKQAKARAAAKLEKSFERRVQEEVDRRTAAQREHFSTIERKFRVRASNAAHLGLSRVELP